MNCKGNGNTTESEISIEMISTLNSNCDFLFFSYFHFFQLLWCKNIPFNETDLPF